MFGMSIIFIFLLLIPAVLCAAEYYLAKSRREAGMYLLPILTLAIAFFLLWYGIVLAAIVLSVGLLTKHLQKIKQSEIEKMSIQDLGGEKQK